VVCKDRIRTMDDFPWLGSSALAFGKKICHLPFVLFQNKRKKKTDTAEVNMDDGHYNGR